MTKERTATRHVAECRYPNVAAPVVVLCLAAVLSSGCSPGAIETKPPVNVDNDGLAPDMAALARTDHIALLEHCLRNARGRYASYTCTFTKQEKLGKMMRPRQVIDVKFLNEPFSVAMVWRENAPAGDRLLYVEGRYGGKMLVRPKGGVARFLVGNSLLKDPAGPEAMQNTLRPVTMFGFERGLENLLKVYRAASEAGDLKTEYGGKVKLPETGRTAIKLTRILPEGKGYPCHRTDIYIDTEWLVPVRIDGFDSRGEQISHYAYSDVDFGAKLTEKDFTPAACGIEPPRGE